MRQILLNDFQLHHATDGSYRIHAKRGIEGIESPEYNVTILDKEGADGAYVAANKYGARNIRIRGTIYADNKQDYQAKRREFLLATTLESNARNEPVLKKLSFETDTGEWFETYVAVARRPQLPDDWLFSADWQLDLVAPDIQLFKQGGIIAGPITRQQGGGFVLPVVLPIISEAQDGGTLLFTNDGDIYVKPIITITGQANAPYLYHVESQSVMQFPTLTMTVSDTLVIDMDFPFISLNDTPAFNYKSQNSEWFSLIPGQNTIYFSTANTTDTGTMQVSFQPAIRGF